MASFDSQTLDTFEYNTVPSLFVCDTDVSKLYPVRGEAAILSTITRYEDVVAKEASEPLSPRLILLSMQGGRHKRFSVTRNILERILVGFRFPTQVLQCIAANNGATARFVEYDHSGSQPAVRFLNTIFQTPNSPAKNFTFVMRTDLTTLVSVILMVERKLSVTYDISAAMKGETLLMKSCEDFRKTLDHEVVSLEAKTGMSSLPYVRIAESERSTDYETLIKDLNRCSTSLIFLENLTTFEQVAGVNVRETTELYRELSGKDKIREQLLPVHTQRQILDRLDFEINLALFRKGQSNSLQKRIQLQITVLYSLISQRDSKLNMIIAEDSRKTAVAAKRDSSSMKTIAALTLVFLPGTFIASLFSTSIFDLQTSNDGSTHISISKLTWIYFVVAIPLTVFTVVVWALYHRWVEQKERQEDAEQAFSKTDLA